MFENTFQGPGTGTYVDHTIEILLMLLVAFLLGLLLGYLLWYKWHKLYQELNAEHNRMKAVLLDLEKEHIGVKYKLEESEKENSSLRRKIMSLEGDITGLKFRLEKSESDLVMMAANVGVASTAIPSVGAISPVDEMILAAAVPIQQDDLKKVEGIGPKIEQILNKDGIWTFTALAATTVDKLKDLLEAAGPAFRIADPETWPRQSELAAEEKWDELKEYQDFLAGGKTPGS